ncbi:putative C-mannosyltransferase DPY19L3, partial [Trichinella murrelli]
LVHFFCCRRKLFTMFTAGKEHSVRQRKKNVGHSSQNESLGSRTMQGRKKIPKEVDSAPSDQPFFMQLLKPTFALFLCMLVGAFYGWYIYQLHDNYLWFSHITELEREISFRTECGLYYSYFKQLIHSPSLIRGIYDLTLDNSTENGHSINILHRFNIYQEVLLAIIYRSFEGWNFTSPAIFYSKVVFSVGGLGASALCLIAYFVSNSILAILVCGMFCLTNLSDMTRAHFVVNLREHFALPMFWLQILFVCVYLKSVTYDAVSRVGKNCIRFCIFWFTFLFMLMWQFNQFAMLFQAMAIYALSVLKLITLEKAVLLFFIHLGALVAVFVLQFFPKMLLSSILVTFNLSALFSLYLFRRSTHSGGVVAGFCKLATQILITIITMVLFTFLLKRLLGVESDDHIFKFLLGKFGFSNVRDFESRVYLCHDAFSFLSNDFFLHTSKTFLFPLYLTMFSGCLFVIGKDLLTQWCDLASLSNNKYRQFFTTDYFERRADLAFLVLQSVIIGLVSLMVTRISYMWSPLMAVLATALLCCEDIWKTLPGFRNRRQYIQMFQLSVIVAILGYNSVLFYNRFQEEMKDLREFWDPDTVNLMEWINNTTAPYASFAGSMQLMAGVKCCTSRPITNHPHFENKQLRDRTKDIYQIYARRSAEDVYNILKKYKTNYIILEDSICRAKRSGCTIPELIDLENGHAPDSRHLWMSMGLVQSKERRFCTAIENMDESFARYFRLIFVNRTFRVYQLL